MIVRFTSKALDDLDHIHERIAADRPASANMIIRQIREATTALSDFPHRGRLGRVKQTGELVVHRTSFIIAYRVRQTEIDILSIVHAARRWPGSLN